MAGSEQQAVAKGVLAAVAAVEDAVDDELQRLDDMGQADLERLREERLQQMKQEAEQVSVRRRVSVLSVPCPMRCPLALLRVRCADLQPPIQSVCESLLRGRSGRQKGMASTRR